MIELTQEEKELKQRITKLSEHLGNYIADYIDKEPLGRRELIGALFDMCYIAFHLQSTCNFEEKCIEINSFCDFLKNRIAEDLNITQEKLNEFK